MPDTNLWTALEPAIARAGDDIAFEPVAGDAVGYGELARCVGRYANALRELGLAPGDRVTAQVDKSFGNIFLYLATLKIGAVFNALNTAYTPAELEYFIADARPKLLVASRERCRVLADAAARHGVRHVQSMEADGSGEIAERAARQADEAQTIARAGDDLACLLYTSGTTGRSKGAMITHGNLVSNARTLHAAWRFEPGDVLLHALPTFHVHGLFVALHIALMNGSKMLWLARFDPAQVLERLPRATVMMGVPTFYTRLLGEAGLNRTSCAGMRLFVAGSAPLLAETHAEFEARTGHRILERYGMTEAGMITANPYETAGRVAGSIGYALADIDVRVADETGGEVARGEIGTLEVCGPNVFKGYWEMPEKTAEEFRSDGYFITGDMASMDDDGRLRIVGRAKDLIISGGFNVYPKEIEEQIDLNPAVGESAVIGLPHPDFGEGVVAVVTPAEPGAPLDSDTVLAPLAGRLARFKQPKTVFVVDELPRNAMGKVQKGELRARYADTFKG